MNMITEMEEPSEPVFKFFRPTAPNNSFLSFAQQKFNNTPRKSNVTKDYTVSLLSVPDECDEQKCLVPDCLKKSEIQESSKKVRLAKEEIKVVKINL